MSSFGSKARNIILFFALKINQKLERELHPLNRFNHIRLLLMEWLNLNQPLAVNIIFIIVVRSY